MRVYTRTGDAGETGLFGNERVSKTDLRIAAIGAVDEANAALGVVLQQALPDETSMLLRRMQSWLFDVGAELSDRSGGLLANLQAPTKLLEESMDGMESSLRALRTFVLPGGGAAAAFLHVARTSCRRAEREILKLSTVEPQRPELLAFVNRLSDWMFVAARWCNQQQGVEDRLWEKFEG